MQAMTIGVVAPSCPIDTDVAARVAARAAALFGDAAPVFRFHPQCFESHGHFAGDDATRLAALLDYANDPAIDAIWFARGGYGAGRIAEEALPLLGPDARAKTWLGYSDAGMLLGALYAQGFGQVAHGPMPADIRRAGGEAAVDRALNWLVARDGASVAANADGAPVAAFNMTILSALIGTRFAPDLAGHVLMLEEVGEHLYRIDRTLFHITSAASIRKVAGIRIGRISEVIENDRPFGYDTAEIVEYWCAKSGIRLLGAADIGHDIDNKVIPFGQAQ